ncbi:MAG: DEDD exonuclease domain-containing protein [Candidatus Nanopelagicales bacterium]
MSGLVVEQQLSLDDLGTPLSEVTFVVVDLETTGGKPVDAGITEIGAVKVRGGEVIGEFQTLVDPGTSIPPFIAALTGITDRMLIGAPSGAAATASFWEFATGAVLVAHNAPYDMSFLRGACEMAELPWPGPRVVDTARLARRAITRDEVRNCKLETLSRFFRSETPPCHRALDDARATVAVLHGLMERMGPLGVHCLEDLLAFGGRTTKQQREKRHLGSDLPEAPGVYIFRDAQGQPLYVGTSRNIRSRVRNYFTASEQRRRMSEMVGLAHRVDPIVCATDLEARVRELRLIAEHRPPYNRRSRNPERQVWLALTREPHPRLVTVSAVRDSHLAAVGPFASRGAASLAAEALHEALPLRTCPERLPRGPKRAAGCVRGQLGQCAAPCSTAGDATEYAAVADRAHAAMTGDAREVIEALNARMATYAADGRFEQARSWRDRLETYLRGSVRRHRLTALDGIEEIVAADLVDGAWHIHVIRHGRLAAAGIAPRGTDPRPVVDALLLTAEDVGPGSALTEESEILWGWLTSGTARLVRTSLPLSSPIHVGGAHALALREAREAAQTVRYTADRRNLRPTA